MYNADKKIKKILELYLKSSNWINAIVKTNTNIIDEVAKLCYNRQRYHLNFDSNKDSHMYAHLIIAHAYLEFITITGIYAYGDNYSVNDFTNKKTYNRFCKVNNVSENLIELGWEKYLND